jgi:hypothetical protein
MASSRFLAIRNPLWLVAASLAAFLALDNGIFRSGLYARFANTETLPAQVFNTVHFENLRPATGKREIFLAGASTMHWAFWCKQYNLAHENTGYAFVMGAIAGTNEEMWYYVLRAVDPDRDRYAAIVIPNAGYIVESWHDDEAENYDDAQMLAPILSLSEWPGVIANFQNPDLRWKAALLAAFPSHGYAADLQDLILHPSLRAARLRQRWAGGAFWLYDWPGTPGSMQDFRAGPGNGGVAVFPSDLNNFERANSIDEFTRPSARDATLYTARNAQFQAFWLNKIIARYAGSSTILIFAQIPRWPMPLPARGPIAGAPDLRQLLTHEDNTVFLPENAFVALEQPKYFHDTIHLNNLGRAIFTNLLGDQVLRVLETQGQEAQGSHAQRKTT